MEDWIKLVLFVLGVIFLCLWVSNNNKKEDIKKLNSDVARLSKNTQEAKAAADKRYEKLQEEKHQLYREASTVKSQLAHEVSLVRSKLTEEANLRSQEFRTYEQRNKLFPWLSTAFADLETYRGEQAAHFLSEKKNPARKAAEEVREFSKRAAKAEKTAKALKYRIDFYEKHFPWLSDFTEGSLEEYLLALESRPVINSESENEVDKDPVKSHLSLDEYSRLTTQERNQLALDRWGRRSKSAWEIGRDYERWVGYTLEKQGYRVNYFGAIQGFDDLGRDLIATNQLETLIVQCKYWSQFKQIHEKHVFQLFGTYVEYAISRGRPNDDLPLLEGLSLPSNIHPVFVTSTALSDRAKVFASTLKMDVRENFALGSYPQIKCNISKASGSRVYHLPFDQQYDRTVIDPSSGEFYAASVAEAEEHGFRRAFKWRPIAGD